MSKAHYEYKQVSLVRTMGDEIPYLEGAANHWAEQGWEVVAVIPAMHTGMAEMLLKRPKPGYVLMSDEEYNETRRQVMERTEHNHPLGVACGDTCPVLVGWNRIGQN